MKALVVIEVDSAQLAEELMNKHNLKHSIEHEGMPHQIPVYTADNISEIRVFDLPCQMPNSIIAKNLSAYGEVISIRNDVWKDVFTGLANGTRFVRMKLHKQIPSYVVMAGLTSFITYNGQTRTCRYCAYNLHLGKTCAQNKKEVLEGELTAAQLISLPGPAKPISSRLDVHNNGVQLNSSTENTIPFTPVPPANTDVPIAVQDEHVPAAPIDQDDQMTISDTEHEGATHGEIELDDSISDTGPNEGRQMDTDQQGRTQRDISPDIESQPTSSNTVPAHPVIVEQEKTHTQTQSGGSSHHTPTKKNDAVGKIISAAAKRPGSPKKHSPKRKLRHRKF